MPPETEEKIDDVAGDVAAAIAELRGEQPASEAPASESDKSPEQVTEQGAPKDDRRDERGRFAAREKPSEESGRQPHTQAAQRAEETQAQKPAASGQPPSWLSPAGKAKWANVPNDIKADIGRMEQEAAAGAQAARMYSDLEPFAQRAAHHGQRLADVIAQYVGIEDLISRDIGAGLTVICRNKGLNQEQAASLFADLARKFGANPSTANGHAQPPQAAQFDPNDPLNDLLQPFLGPVMQKLQTVEERFSNFYTAQEQAQRAQFESQVNSLADEITKFAADPAHIFFDDVEPIIDNLFRSGLVPRTGNHAADLQKAYDMAVRMDDRTFSAWQGQQQEAREAERRAKEQEAAEKARKASRSLSGSRIPGTVVQPAQPMQGQDDVMADVVAAYRSATAS